MFSPAFDVDPWFLLLPLVWMGALIFLWAESVIVFYINSLSKGTDTPRRGPLYNAWCKAVDRNMQGLNVQYRSERDVAIEIVSGKILSISFLYCATLLSYKAGLGGLLIWVFCIYLPIRTKLKEFK